jgi:hypothetical protein
MGGVEIALNGDLNKPFMPKTLHIKHLCINKITFYFAFSLLMYENCEENFLNESALQNSFGHPSVVLGKFCLNNTITIFTKF